MFKNIEKLENESLAKHTTLHTGGNARWFLLPKDEIELESIVYECRLTGFDYFILGSGSNLLVSDDGFSGAVISMKKFNQIQLLGEDEIKVGAGVNLFALNAFCLKNGLGGLEWSYGIPATVGGAVKMNAGAFGGEFCKFLSEITFFNGISIKKSKKINFSYRKGCLKPNEVLISATLKLSKKGREEIKKEQEKYFLERKRKQPYGEFSLGSVFKRGSDFLPAKLIDEFGFKGIGKGDMVVSEKHSGFIVNKGNGSARDFLELVCLIEKRAKQEGVKFEREFTELGF